MELTSIARCISVAIFFNVVTPISGIARSCSYLYYMGIRESGYYAVDLDGLGKISHINCSFRGDHIRRLINHDHENERYSNGHTDFALKEDIIYRNKSYVEVRDIVTSSKNCSYTLNFRCRGVGMNDNAWRDYQNAQHIVRNSQGTVNGQDCEYDKLTSVSRTLTEWNLFPMTKIEFGDTNGDHEEMYYQIEALTCEEVPTYWDNTYRREHMEKFKGNSRLTKVDKTISPLRCSLPRCAVLCLNIGCSAISFRRSPCTCELSLSYDGTSILYQEESALGFVLYKMTSKGVRSV